MTARATARELAKARYAEACAVVDAFDSQVVKRRKAWINADTPDANARARRALTQAVEQRRAAMLARAQAWKVWHALR